MQETSTYDLTSYIIFYFQKNIHSLHPILPDLVLRGWLTKIKYKTNKKKDTRTYVHFKAIINVPIKANHNTLSVLILHASSKCILTTIMMHQLI